MAKEQSADEDLDDLRSQMTAKDQEIADERAKRVAAENERGAAQAKAAEEINNRVAADEVAIRSALGTAAAETKALEAEYAAAAERGDYAVMASINTKIVGTQQRISGFTTQAAQIENWKKAQLAEIEKRGTQHTVAPTEDQQLAAYTPRTREWLKAHTDVLRDPRRMAKATAAHFDAIAENIPFESDAYFDFVSKRTGVGGATSTAAEIEDPETEEVVIEDTTSEKKTEPPVRAKETTRAPTDSAAAPSRETPDISRRSGKDRPGTVRLSASEQEAARFSFPHLKPDEAYVEYGKNKVALQQEGRL